MGRQGSGSAVSGSLIFLGVIALLSLMALATDYNVGGNDGTWAVPTSANGLNYSRWAASNTFKKNDRLIFRYDPNLHSVLRVTPQDYAACNFSRPLQTYHQDNGDLELDVQLENEEMYYFICGTQGHCPVGQKFSVAVQKAAAAALTYSLPMVVAVTTFGSYLVFV